MATVLPNGNTISGTTLGPSVIPEPGTLTLLGIALSPGLFAVRRRVLLSRSR
jgi:hypothetical protein